MVQVMTNKNVIVHLFQLPNICGNSYGQTRLSIPILRGRSHASCFKPIKCYIVSWIWYYIITDCLWALRSASDPNNKGIYDTDDGDYATSSICSDDQLDTSETFACLLCNGRWTTTIDLCRPHLVTANFY